MATREEDRLRPVVYFSGSTSKPLFRSAECVVLLDDRGSVKAKELKRAVPRLLAVRALAEATTVPATTWYTLIARGEIPVVRIGRSVRVCEEDLVAWLERHREREP